MTFRSKIDLLRKMLMRFDMLAEVVSSELVKKLDEVRDVRNRFAHYPVSFKQVTLQSGELDVVATLECRDESIELNEAYLQHIDQLIGEVQQALQYANKQIFEKQKSLTPGA